MLLQKLFYILLILVAVNSTDVFIRTATTIKSYFKTGFKSLGVNVKKINNTTHEILYTEEFNADTNPLKINFNYFFENTGKRQIRELDNLCADYKKDTPEYAAKFYVLGFLANTDKCPIKKGTKVIFKTGVPYKYSNTNPGCGIIHGSVSMFKANYSKSGETPLVLLFNFYGNVTGTDC